MQRGYASTPATEVPAGGAGATKPAMFQNYRGYVAGTPGVVVHGTIDANGHSTFAGVISGSTGDLALTKVGDGTLVLSGSNTYASGTTISGGNQSSGQQPPSADRPWTWADKQANNGTPQLGNAGAEPSKAVETAAVVVPDSASDDVARGISNNVVYHKSTSLTPQKPLETWKPARVVPNSSRLMVGDKEELPLKGMQVDVRVDGFRARVLIDLYYFNDRPQQLEGNFQLRLPDEAAPYFFAFGRTVYQAPQVTANDSMFFKPQQVSQGDTTPEKILALRGNSWEQPKVARMVPKEKAALAYRDTVRRRVDPALVEWSGAGVFQCRVFPLAPQSLHRVTIGYDVDLLRVGDDLELRLDLPGQTPADDRRSEHRRQRRPASEPRRPRHGFAPTASGFPIG